jgi:hypothetical protein
MAPHRPPLVVVATDNHLVVSPMVVASMRLRRLSRGGRRCPRIRARLGLATRRAACRQQAPTEEDAQSESTRLHARTIDRLRRRLKRRTRQQGAEGQRRGQPQSGCLLGEARLSVRRHLVHDGGEGDQRLAHYRLQLGELRPRGLGVRAVFQVVGRGSRWVLETMLHVCKRLSRRPHAVTPQPRVRSILIWLGLHALSLRRGHSGAAQTRSGGLGSDCRRRCVVRTTRSRRRRPRPILAPAAVGYAPHRSP